MEFANILREEFDNDRYICCIIDGKVEIYLCIHLDAHSPHILLLFDQSINDKTKCSLWEASLTDEKILKHVTINPPSHVSF
jgi:hypothetical protein